MKKIKARDLISFFQGLHTLLNAGLGLMTALELQTRERHFLTRELIQVAACLREGQAFSTALTRYFILPHEILIYLRLGESTGNLAQACQFCINMLQDQIVWKRMLWQISFYPVLLCITSLALFWVMIGFVLPEFASLYQTLQVSLPRSTAWVLDFSKWAPALFAYIGIMIFVLMLAVSVAWRTTEGRFWLENA
jgi:type IV pilus assembly protein PilC